MQVYIKREVESGKVALLKVAIAFTVTTVNLANVKCLTFTRAHIMLDKIYIRTYAWKYIFEKYPVSPQVNVLRFSHIFLGPHSLFGVHQSGFKGIILRIRNIYFF